MASADPSIAPGLDLAAVWAHLARPWRELQRVPPIAWLGADPPVCVLHADGRESLWADGAPRKASAADCAAARFVAVELSADETLECPVPLPPMASSDRQDALALAVRMASPFEAHELVWGWRDAEGQGPATAMLASRRAVQARLDAAAGRVGRRGAPEVWAFDGRGRPVVLQGHGELARQRRRAHGRWLGWALLISAALLAAAVLVTPTVQLKLRAMQAVRAYAEVERQLAPVLAQREAVVKAQAQQAALRDLMAERVEPLAVLDLLTQAVPDDSHLQRLQLQGTKATLIGQTPNTAALMNTLSGQPLVRDVRSPNPSTRSMTAGRENFAIELTLQPDALRPPAAAAAVVPPALPASAPAAPAPAASVAAAASAAASGASR
jgi:general secretion pathway protein L